MIAVMVIFALIAFAWKNANVQAMLTVALAITAPNVNASQTMLAPMMMIARKTKLAY